MIASFQFFFIFSAIFPFRSHFYQLPRLSQKMASIVVCFLFLFLHLTPFFLPLSIRYSSRFFYILIFLFFPFFRGEGYKFSSSFLLLQSPSFIRVLSVTLFFFSFRHTCRLPPALFNKRFFSYSYSHSSLFISLSLLLSLHLRRPCLVRRL